MWEELLCEVVPPNLSCVGVHCCLSRNPFQRAYMGSQGTPHARPASRPAPFTEQLLKKIGWDSYGRSCSLLALGCLPAWPSAWGRATASEELELQHQEVSQLLGLRRFKSYCSTRG